MDTIVNNIDKQLLFNRGKNIFYNNAKGTLRFIDTTIDTFYKVGKLNNGDKNKIIDYTVNKVLDEFYFINQYYCFNKRSINELYDIYVSLFECIKLNNKPLNTISENHYCNLKNWLNKHNQFAKKLYYLANKNITPVACSEYSAALQLQILNIDVNNIKIPFLDIGCGKNSNLVNYLCKNGLDAFGIDRCMFLQKNLVNCNWLEFNYGTQKWGTIVSNLGFSNHFVHHNLRPDGNFTEYATVYMNILKSLKIGGTFSYAPNLPFIECYLNPLQFAVKTFKIKGSAIISAKVTRLV